MRAAGSMVAVLGVAAESLATQTIGTILFRRLASGRPSMALVRGRERGSSTGTTSPMEGGGRRCSEVGRMMWVY
ncbi:MAG: hypothetical protein PHX77_03715 [Candidatus Bipolaricaulis sp.]|nr:hypothetical protein [Candidatus Bipolaricaulis sp.]